MGWPFLPADHPWKLENDRVFTLEEWYHGRTETSAMYDIIWWMYLFGMVLIAVNLKYL
jgi:hypothetical protein